MVADKSPDAFRTISEVAEELDLPQHVLRFWETRFNQIKPLKRGGGRRFYRPDDIDLLRGIRHLLYGEGYTIRGVQRILKEQGLRFVQNIWREGAPSLDSLPRDDRFERPPLERRLAGYVDEAGPDGDDPGDADTGTDGDDMASLEQEFDGEIEMPEPPPAPPASPPPRSPTPAVAPEPMRLERMAPPTPAPSPPPEPARPNVLRVPQIATGTFGTAAPQHAGSRLFQPPPEAPRAVAQPPQPPRPVTAPPSSMFRNDDPPPPRGIIVDPPEPRTQPVMDKHPSIIDRLRGATGSSRPDAAPVETGGGKGQLSRDDVRKLQSILFELLECKRVLDQAR